MNTLSRILTISLLAVWWHSASVASPTDPVVVTSPPSGQGDPQIPGARTLADLSMGYVEEEFFISGTATLFNYGHNPPLGPTDIVPIAEGVPYTTRIIVRRPERANKFNGTVVIEWWNSTAGFDTAPVWDASAEYFARNGILYVGVTNSTDSINYLANGCMPFGLLPPTCGSRYATLSLPENGLAFEMVSQIANLLKSDASENPIPSSYPVERIFHAGESQQGGSVIAYASSFHLQGINDGYFIQAFATARPINFGPVCGEQDSLSYPDCTPRLVYPDNLVRTDLPVPVYHLVTQMDMELVFVLLCEGADEDEDYDCGDDHPLVVARQPDTPTFRYYEVAGGGHVTVHKDVELIPAGPLGPDPIFLEDLCLNPINSTGDGPVFVSYVMNALWERMYEQSVNGFVPPAGQLMDVDSSTGTILRDAYGNGLGGVRLPSLEMPTATYISGNQADPDLPLFLQEFSNLACLLSGSVFPFDQATLDGLYRNDGQYTSGVAAAVKALKSQGLLLQRDAITIKQAAASGVPD